MPPRNQTKILIRATNWVGDAVMSLPAVRAVREAFPGAQLTVLARGSVAGLYARERAVDRVMLLATIGAAPPPNCAAKRSIARSFCPIRSMRR